MAISSFKDQNITSAGEPRPHNRRISIQVRELTQYIKEKINLSIQWAQEMKFKRANLKSLGPDRTNIIAISY
jgi:hypothetical protein